MQPSETTAPFERFEPGASRPERLVAYVVSDVHLNNHPYDRGAHVENPRRRHFRQFLQRVNNAHDDGTQKLLLILNGDILDITGSWFDEPLPWDADEERAEENLLHIVDTIVENNAGVFAELRLMLGFANTEIHYVVGNHDHLLSLFPRTQELLRERTCPSPASRERFRFVSKAEFPELGLFVMHGHQLDFFNRSDAKRRFPVGDYVNILLINRFVDRVTDELQANGYSHDFIEDVRGHLHEIEYLRPISLIPLWLQSISDRYVHHPQNQGRERTVEHIIQTVISEVFDIRLNNPLAERLKLNKPYVKTLVNALIRLPGAMRFASFVFSLAGHRNSNKKQYKLADRLRLEHGYRFVAMGHTHKPSVVPLGKEAYFFNTGSWKSVINLFKPIGFEEAMLSQLSPKVHFNKIEYMGVLHLEKDLANPDETPHFSLQTIQSDVQVTEPIYASLKG